MKTKLTLLAARCGLTAAAIAATPDDGSVLPFPPTRAALLTELKRTVPAACSGSESFDVGTDLGSTVSRDYFERRPLKFAGKIDKATIHLK